MKTETILLGYRVKTSNGCFITTHPNEPGQYDTSWAPPASIAIAEAYRIVSVYLKMNPGEPVPSIDKVESVRELTPIECASKELGDLLFQLTERNGLDLGLSRTQVERKIAQELAELGATPVIGRFGR